MPPDARTDGFAIRPVRPDDLDAVYEIAHRTGAAGEDATGLIEDRRLVGELWAAPYVTLEPEHASVLVDADDVPVGYVLGALDAVAFEERCEREWWPALRERHPLTPGGDRLDDLLIALIHNRWPREPEIEGPYPSELHIDLLPVAQGSGWGRRMMATVLRSLRAAGSPAAHLGTSVANTRAVGFYEHLGLERLREPDEVNDAIVFGLRLDSPSPLLDDPPQEPR